MDEFRWDERSKEKKENVAKLMVQRKTRVNESSGEGVAWLANLDRQAHRRTGSHLAHKVDLGAQELLIRITRCAGSSFAFRTREASRTRTLGQL